MRLIFYDPKEKMLFSGVFFLYNVDAGYQLKRLGTETFEDSGLE